jgi:hypothetical protein
MYTKFNNSPPLPKFSGNKDEAPAYVEAMDGIFLMHNTTLIVSGDFRGDMPARPPVVGYSAADRKERYDDWKADCAAWKKQDLRDNEQSSLSRSAFHASLIGVARSMMDEVIMTAKDRAGHPIPMQVRLRNEWRKFLDLFMPKIEDFAAICRTKIDLATDSGGIPFLNEIYVTNLGSITKLVDALPDHPALYRLDPATGLAVLAPELYVCPYRPSDEALRTSYLRAIKDSYYAPEKNRLENLKAPFLQCMRDITAVYDRRNANESYDQLRGQPRTDGHPFSNALVIQTKETQAQEQIKMEHLTKFAAPAIPIDFPTYQRQVLASQGTAYRRDQAGYYASEDRNSDRRDDRNSDRRDDRNSDRRDDRNYDRSYDRRDDRSRSNDRRSNDNSRVNNQPQQSNGWNSRTQGQCWNCGDYGHSATDCTSTTCNTCKRSWPSVNSTGRHTSANCPTRSPGRGRSGSRDRNSRDRSRDRSTEFNTFSNANSSGRSNSPRNQSSSSQPYSRPGTPARDDSN